MTTYKSLCMVNLGTLEALPFAQNPTAQAAKAELIKSKIHKRLAKKGIRLTRIEAGSARNILLYLRLARVIRGKEGRVRFRVAYTRSSGFFQPLAAHRAGSILESLESVFGPVFDGSPEHHCGTSYVPCKPEEVGTSLLFKTLASRMEKTA